MNNIQNKLAILRETFYKNLHTKLADLKTSWNNYKKTKNAETKDQFYRIVHNLCGSAKTYGFDDIGQIATDLEKEALNIMNHDANNNEEKIELLLSSLTKLIK